MKLFAKLPPRRSFIACLLGLTMSLAHGESVIEITVLTADGTTIQGDLIRMTADGIQLGQESDELRPNDSLSEITFPNSVKQSLPTVVELIGGTKIHVSSVTSDGERFELAPARQSKLELPVSELKSIRYRPSNPATDAVWLGWTEESRRGDRLAVRRDGRTLDSLDGTVVGIRRDAIQFEMGGNTIDAPIAKLEGVLFSATQSERSQAGIRVNDTSGSQFVAESVELSPARTDLQITLAGSVRHSIPIDQVLSIQYAGGILRLNDAEIASSQLIIEGSTSSPSTLRQSMQTWFSPRVSGSEDDGDNNKVTMSCPGEISFRVPPDYKQFSVAVRRQSEVDEFLPVTVEVHVDGQKQWSGIIKDRKSLGLELPTNDARLLTLKVLDMPTVQSNNATPATVSLGGSIEWFSGRLLK